MNIKLDQENISQNIAYELTSDNFVGAALDAAIVAIAENVQGWHEYQTRWERIDRVVIYEIDLLDEQREVVANATVYIDKGNQTAEVDVEKLT